MDKEKKSRTVQLKRLIFSTMFKSTIFSVLAILLFISVVLAVSLNLVREDLSIYMENTLTTDIEESMTNAIGDMEGKLNDVGKHMTMVRFDNEFFFQHMEEISYPDPMPVFGVHPNGVYYQLNNDGGSSLYYSSDTVIDEYAMEKAAKSVYMDRLFKEVTDSNELIVQVYFNSWDNMNRLYPFMPDAPAQYGPTLNMTDYNFYYLADREHDPDKKPVWTTAYLDPAGQGWMVSCIVPVYNNGFLEGVSGADITLAVLIKSLLNVNLPVDSSVFLTDSEGGIIAMNSASEKLLGVKELTSHEYENAIDYTIYKPDEYNLAMQPEGSLGSQLVDMLKSDYRNVLLKNNGDNFLVHSKVINTTGWQIFILTDESNLLEQVENVETTINRTVQLSVLVIFIIIMFMLLLAVLQADKIARQISEPIMHLQMATSVLGHEMNKIEYGQGTHITEINDLFSQYNKMVEELDERTKLLIEKEAERKLQEEIAEKFKVVSNEDSLTKIANRRRIDDALEEEMAKAVKNEDPLSLILIDIDNFKTVNDEFGHLKGDDVLVEFAKILVSHTKSTDLVGRWGGEEFMIICPYTNLEQAGMLAEKLRSILEDTEFATGQSHTASFGVAEYYGEDKKTFVNKVDVAMYKAKQSSKNRVVIHREIEEDLL